MFQLPTLACLENNLYGPWTLDHHHDVSHVNYTIWTQLIAPHFLVRVTPTILLDSNYFLFIQDFMSTYLHLYCIIFHMLLEHSQWSSYPRPRTQTIRKIRHLFNFTNTILEYYVVWYKGIAWLHVTLAMLCISGVFIKRWSQLNQSNSAGLRPYLLTQGSVFVVWLF